MFSAQAPLATTKSSSLGQLYSHRLCETIHLYTAFAISRKFRGSLDSPTWQMPFSLRIQIPSSTGASWDTSRIALMPLPLQLQCDTAPFVKACATSTLHFATTATLFLHAPTLQVQPSRSNSSLSTHHSPSWSYCLVFYSLAYIFVSIPVFNLMMSCV